MGHALSDEAQEFRARNVTRQGVFLANAQPLTRRMQDLHFPASARPPIRAATLDTETGEIAHRRALTDKLVAHVSALPEPERAGLEAGSQSFFLGPAALALQR